MFFLIFGVLGSFRLFKQPIIACILDIFTCIKFIIGYLAVRIFWKDIDKDFLEKNLSFFIKIIITILFILVLHDEIFNPIFPINEIRYGFRSMRLFYPHPTYLAASGIVLLIVLADMKKINNKMLYMIMISIVIVSTLRSKAIAFTAFFWLLYILVVKLNIKSKYIYMFFGIPIIIYLGYNQILIYFFNKNWSARQVMLQDAIKIAKEYFPLGSGFASFGTNMSVVYYSPLYYKFKYNLIEGMASKNAAYLNDGFWQAVIGQFGFIGLVCFLFIIYYFFKIILSKKFDTIGKDSYCSIISLNIYLVIASVGEMAYFSPYAILFFLIMAIILNESENKLDCDKDKFNSTNL